MRDMFRKRQIQTQKYTESQEKITKSQTIRTYIYNDIQKHRDMRNVKHGHKNINTHKYIYIASLSFIDMYFTQDCTQAYNSLKPGI